MITSGTYKYTNKIDGGTEWVYHNYWSKSGYLNIKTNNLYCCNLFDVFDDTSFVEIKESTTLYSKKTTSLADYTTKIAATSSGLFKTNFFGWIKNHTSVGSVQLDSVSYQYNVKVVEDDCKAYAKVGSQLDNQFCDICFWIFLVMDN
jgi:hypothetical protein